MFRTNNTFYYETTEKEEFKMLKKFKKKETELQKEIKRNYEVLANLDPTSDEYLIVLANIKELEKMGESESNDELKIEVFKVGAPIIAYGALFLIGMSYERDNVFTFESFKKLRDVNKPRFIK